MLLLCLTLASVGAVLAMPPGWKGTPQEVKHMTMCGEDIFNINNVNVESAKMTCQNETGLDLMTFWYMLQEKGKHMHHNKGMPMPEGESWPEGEGELEGYAEGWPVPEGEGWPEPEGEEWPEPEGEGWPEPEGEGWPEPEGGDGWQEMKKKMYKLMKMCKSKDFGEDSSEEGSSEEDFDMDVDIETMEPEKLRELTGKMKKKMMKMKCYVMMMMMKKKRGGRNMRMPSFSDTKNTIHSFPDTMQQKLYNFEICIGRRMGYMDAQNNIIRDAIGNRIEEVMADTEVTKNKVLDKLDACIANEEPQMLSMCLKMDCMLYQKMYGKKYKCVEA